MNTDQLVVVPLTIGLLPELFHLLDEFCLLVTNLVDVVEQSGVVLQHLAIQDLFSQTAATGLLNRIGEISGENMS